MTMMRFDPLRELDRITEQFLWGTRGVRAIPMEAYRRGEQVLIHLDLPGVDEDDIDLTVEGNTVNVHAVRRSPRQEGDEVIVDERPKGEFTRQLLLGENLDVGGLSANYDRGVLTVMIPVSETAKPRRVQIQAPAQQAEGDSGERASQQQPGAAQQSPGSRP